MAKQKKSTVPRRRGIQSVGTGLRVLEVLANFNEPATLGVVAQESGLSASQAHRYLSSLLESGMAVQDPATGRYEIGPTLLKLGLAALARVDALRIADAAITEFARRSGRTVQIAALGPLGPTIVRWNVGAPRLSAGHWAQDAWARFWGRLSAAYCWAWVGRPPLY